MAQILGFQARDEVLATALADFAGKRKVPVTRATGLAVTATVSLSEQDRAVIGRKRDLRALLNRILTNVGTLGVRRIRKIIIGHDAIRTRLFLTGWRAERVAEQGVSYNTGIRFTNPAPYALYVHPKRTARSRTIVNVDVRGQVLPALQVELTKDLERLRPKIAAAVKADIVARLRGGR